MGKLKDLANDYRQAAALLRIAIDDTEEILKTADEKLKHDLNVKLKSLKESLKETRDLCDLCEIYFDSPIPERLSTYTTIGMKADRTDATKK